MVLSVGRGVIMKFMVQFSIHIFVTPCPDSIEFQLLAVL
jgi:hypothetical protein